MNQEKKHLPIRAKASISPFSRSGNFSVEFLTLSYIIAIGKAD
ncbi:hypothetical protein [[Phormidium] sp. LEGE 05292]|nr:hypothetical protein [Phormidium sp. LEGE 05292]